MRKIKTKVCTTCGKRQSIKLFSNAANSNDGLAATCKVCHIKICREWREDHSNHCKKYAKKYRKNHVNTRVKSPGVARAHRLVAEAIVDGRIKVEPCEECGSRRAQPHHEDYRKVYDIRWLCQSHHARRHAQKKFAKRGIRINVRLANLERLAA